LQRLVNGETLFDTALDAKALIDQLVHMIMENGQQVRLGEAKAHPVASKPGQLLLIIPVSLRISDTLLPALSKVTTQLNGTIRSQIRLNNSREMFIEKMFRVGTSASSSAIGTLIRLAEDYQLAAYFQSRIRPSTLEVRISNSMGDPRVCVLPLLVDPVGDRPKYYNRLFPVIRNLRPWAWTVWH
jgi:uncharacterized membrane protein (UPF0182 family)